MCTYKITDITVNEESKLFGSGKQYKAVVSGEKTESSGFLDFSAHQSASATADTREDAIAIAKSILISQFNNY
jgi:hypothetical protein